MADRSYLAGMIPPPTPGATVNSNLNLFDLPPEGFRSYLNELAAQGVNTDELMRQYRRANSPFSGLFDWAINSERDIANEGRTTAGAGLFSKEAGTTGMDALASTRIEPANFIAGLLSGGAQAVDAAGATLKGLVPAADMPMEALGTAGMAMTGGAAAPKPRGALGANSLRAAEDVFGKDWADRYHWTRSPEFIEQFNPDLSTSAMSQLGPHTGTLAAAEARKLAYPNEVGQMMPLRANLQKPYLDPRTGKPWTEVGLEVHLSEMADYYGVDRREVAPILRRELASQGYTDIPYINDVEDAGSVSNIMLVDRPSNSDAVLRYQDALFDPLNRYSANLSAANRDATTGAIALPAARNEAERMARQILEMRAAGRAGDVTDAMMAQADPQYMFNNTPLPMDEASRMARAGEMGFGESGLHGTVTSKDFPAFRSDRETYVAPLSDEGLDLVAQFSTADQGRILPLLHTSNILDTSSPDGMFQQRRDMQRIYDEQGLGDFRAGDKGLPSWMDTAAINAAKDAGYGGIRLDERDWVNSTAVYDPTNIRSRFARFDPEFSHLANLNAANASPLAGILAMPNEEERNRQLGMLFGGYR